MKGSTSSVLYSILSIERFDLNFAVAYAIIVCY